MSTSPLPSPSAGVRASSTACAVGSPMLGLSFDKLQKKIHLGSGLSDCRGSLGLRDPFHREFFQLEGYTSASSSQYRPQASSASVITSVCLSIFFAKLLLGSAACSSDLSQKAIEASLPVPFSKGGIQSLFYWLFGCRLDLLSGQRGFRLPALAFLKEKHTER